MDNLEGGLKEILAEELQKEISLFLTDQSIEKDLKKIYKDIITPGTDLDNGEVYDIKTGETIRGLY